MSNKAPGYHSEVDARSQEHESCIEYSEIGENNPYFQAAVAKRNEMIRDHLTDSEEQPCLSKTIVFEIIIEGEIVSMGDNGTKQPIQFCPKLVFKDPTYRYCAEVCGQEAHAEINAVIQYLVNSGMVTIEEINELYEKIENVMYPENPKLREIQWRRIAHKALFNFIKERELTLPEGAVGYMYGHTVCCKQCHDILNLLGLNTVMITPESADYERSVRESFHSSPGTIERIDRKEIYADLPSSTSSGQLES